MYEKVHSAVMVDVEFNLLAPCFFIRTYLRYLFYLPLSAWWPAVMTEIVCGFRQFFQKNTNVEAKLYNDRFLLHSFQFVTL